MAQQRSLIGLRCERAKRVGDALSDEEGLAGVNNDKENAGHKMTW